MTTEDWEHFFLTPIDWIERERAAAPDAIRRRAGSTTGEQLSAATSPRWTPLPHQIPPEGDFYGWLLLAGRMAGKTDACAAYVHDHVHGPPCLPGPVPHWIAIIGPTLGDAVTSCFSGPSGLSVHSPDAKLATVKGSTIVRWPNGSEAKIFGTNGPNEVDRLRSGGNRCLAWLEELAAWRHLDAAWNHMRFGLRVGPRPHWVASTTPKPKPLIKQLHSGAVANVELTHASYRDNPHISEDIKASLEERYAGTQLGRQELYGELIEEDENALWQHTMIDDARVRPGDVPDLVRITVGVDPSGGAGEQGIVVVGKSGLVLPGDGGRPQHHGYVLDDRSCQLSPDGWGRRAVQAAIDWEADDIVVERNFGGDMAVATLRAAADALGVDIPIRTVTATRGKAVRAEPVAALTAQNRWHHAGEFPKLEDQMATWYPEAGWSPDRLDAAVWGAWHLKLVGTAARGTGSLGGELARKQIVGGRVR